MNLVRSQAYLVPALWSFGSGDVTGTNLFVARSRRTPAELFLETGLGCLSEQSWNDLACGRPSQTTSKPQIPRRVDVGIGMTGLAGHACCA